MVRSMVKINVKADWLWFYAGMVWSIKKTYQLTTSIVYVLWINWMDCLQVDQINNTSSMRNDNDAHAIG